MKKIALMMAGAFVLGSSAGFAGQITKHEEHEEQRIEKGAKHGQLTPKEKERLDNQQQTIEKEREQAWQDGKMSKREKRDIRHDQKRLSHDIENKRHNERKPKQ